MFGFFRPRNQIPPFPHVEGHPYLDRYFLRTASWRVYDKGTGSIAVTDPVQPRIITLDPWPQLVFLAADGQRTIKEYTLHMAHQYTGKIPPEVNQTILDQIKALLDNGLIRLSPTPERPEPEHQTAKD